MKEFLKDILKWLRIYHPLQSYFRGVVSSVSNNLYRRKFAKYKGPGYNCNVCNSAYTRFIPRYPQVDVLQAIQKNNVIAGYGENVLCPNCMSTKRERLVIAVMQDWLEINNKKILHFSPEKNVFAYIKSKGIVVTVDLMPGFYKAIDPSITYADARQLHYFDEEFDIVIANHVMEHIPEDIKAMKEIHRVLKKDGTAILQVPYSETLSYTLEEPFINDPAKQKSLFGQKDHVRIYCLNDYIDRLQKAGFFIKLLTPDILQPLRQHAIEERESFLLCYKSGEGK